jgi:hypothetical protein
MTVPYSFANATVSIPLSQLDANFNTPITLGNTAIQLGNTVTTLNNMTLANVTISSGNVTITNVSVTTANVTTLNATTVIATTANVTTANITTGNVTNMSSGNVAITGGSINGTTLGATTASTANVTTLTTSSTVTINGGTANGVAYLDGSKVLTTGSALVFDGTNLGIGTSSPWTKLSVYGSGDQRIAVTSPTGGSTIAAIDLSPSLTAGEAAANAPQARIYAVDSNYSANIIFASKVTGATANALQTRMTLDSSGNLGLGVTPSAWGGSFKAFQIASGGTSLWSDGSVAFYNRNTFYDGTNRKYVVDGFAQEYAQLNDGSHAWKITTSGSANGNISFTQAMTLDASGRLLVATTSNTDGSALQVDAGNVGSTLYTALFRNTNTSTAVYNTLRFIQGATGSATGYVGTGGSTVGNAAFQNNFVVGTQTSSALVFATNDTERARITSGGDLLVGTTSATSRSGITAKTVSSAVSSQDAISAQTNSNSYFTVCSHVSTTSGTRYHIGFGDGTTWTERGTISTDGTSTSYNTSSDYRLKNITGPVTNSGAYIDALKPVEGTWKADGSTFVGLIAHEVQEVSRTNIATGTKDGERMQGMDYSASEIIANLIAEVQSLRARVAQLENLKGN